MIQKNLVILGSAPLTIDYSDMVNKADFVIRFNDCKNIGGYSGSKTSAICISSTGKPACEYVKNKSISKLACYKTAEIWFARQSVTHNKYFEKVKSHFPMYLPTVGFEDHSKNIIESNNLEDRIIKYFSKDLNNSVFEKLLRLAESPFICPSTGVFGLEGVFADSRFSKHRIHVIGFGFQGWHGHPWVAERKLFFQYSCAGSLVIYPV